MSEPLMSADDVAAYLRVPIATIYKWRSCGTGPRAARVGKHLRYRAVDVARWLDANTDAPTVGAR